MGRKKKEPGTDVVKVDGVSPDTLAKVSQVRDTTSAFLQSMQGASIDTQQEHDTVTQYARMLRETRNELEADRKAITAPMLAAKARVDDLFRPATEMLDSCLKLCAGLLDHHAAQQRTAMLAAQDAIRASGVDNVPTSLVVTATGESAVLLSQGSYSKTVTLWDAPDHKALDTGVVCYLTARGVSAEIVNAVRLSLEVPVGHGVVQLAIDHDYMDRAVKTLGMQFKAHGVVTSEKTHVVA